MAKRMPVNRRAASCEHGMPVRRNALPKQSVCSSFVKLRGTTLQPLFMHRLPSKSAIWRMRMAAVLLWLMCIAAILVIVAFVMAFMERSPEQVRVAIMSLIGFVVLAIIQWLVSLRTKCPLCVTPVLAAKNCSKNKKAKTFMGSYRLRVANNVLLNNYFRCPYCSEPTELVVRDRHSRR